MVLPVNTPNDIDENAKLDAHILLNKYKKGNITQTILAEKLRLTLRITEIEDVLKEDPELLEYVKKSSTSTRNRTTNNTSKSHNTVNRDTDHNGNPELSVENDNNGSTTATTPDIVYPPENFSHVVGDIYRSSYPRLENVLFLAKHLKLKSILVLIPEDYPQELLTQIEKYNIKIFQVGMSGNKEPFVNIPNDLLTKALEIVINPENHPILIHCNRGKHRTGCIVGCIRKLQNWSLTMIFDEYRRFAFPKARALDQQFIEMYDIGEIISIASENNWLPIKW
ncbi:putative tyrosine protein phosphatase SIW14 SCDLUD_002743 [Saccharomycodes ludwigii]|uniref:putative tyrosine protein phosphatase SIW14 n=1 Tax=Saccharomycodes ludwigii TaxID=36035 RepID=UPI001E863844|nr:hypothetical protein SCDLUD_002743 [Saccharomycodes ludwigii]KAH3901254.1 hypothetical protein SCDLUD_002743 [Saccharomycodes ludwigii]